MTRSSSTVYMSARLPRTIMSNPNLKRSTRAGLASARMNESTPLVPGARVSALLPQVHRQRFTTEKLTA